MGVLQSRAGGHKEASAQALASKGAWIHLGTYGQLVTVRNLKRAVESGRHPAYASTGSFEVRYELGDLDYEVYVRSV